MKKIVQIISLLIFLLLTFHSTTFASGKGFWSTKGGKIVDENENIVRIAGINWGFLVYNANTFGELFGSRKANYKEMMNAIKKYGFNTIRLPWRNELLQSDCQFKNVGNHNDELVGLSCLEVMDKIVEYAGNLNLRIILDHHTPSGRGFTSSDWLPAWKKLATRYKGNETIIGVDLDNEPYYATACWGCGGTNDWKKSSQNAGNAILNINPKWLIIIEDILGADSLYTMATNNPISLTKQNKLVYSTHVYGWSISNSSEWNNKWGNIVKQNIAPVLVGEFNVGKSVNKTSLAWFDTLTSYMKSNDIGGTGWAWLYDDPKNSGESWYVQSLINPDYLTLQDDDRQKSFRNWYVKLDPIVNKPSNTPTPTSIATITITPSVTNTPTTTPEVTISNTPSVTPSLTPSVKKSADANSDNVVDGLDYVIWLNNYGKNLSGKKNGDFNKDKTIDGLDYVVWLNEID